MKDFTSGFAIILFFWLAVVLAGCSGNRGWRFEIGVSPVSNLHNTAGLTDNENKKEEESKWKR